jgi:hypothetical protein
MCYIATPGKTGCLSAHFDGCSQPKKKVATVKKEAAGQPNDGTLRRLSRTGPAHASPIHVREMKADWDEVRGVRQTHHTRRPKWRRIPTVPMDPYWLEKLAKGWV